MIRYVLLLCAGLLAAAGFACVQAPPPAPPPPVVPLAASWPLAVCNASNFAANVTILSAGFDPTAHPYVPPSGSTRPGWIIQQDLQDAFSNAPAVVQNHLCTLSGGVFINPGSCSTAPCNAGGLFANSWGFRSRQGTDKGRTYVAIPAQLWPSGSHAVAFSAYEDAILQYLTAKIGAPGWTAPSSRPIISSSMPPDQPWLTVLASLAHELGHVQWTLDTVKNPGNDYDFSALQNCPIDASGTTIDFFQGWDYQRKKQLAPPNRWRMFADRTNDENSTTLHTDPPQWSDFTKSFADPNQLLFQLYQGDQSGNYQPWASLFAAEAPDEDFVETYVMYALLGNRFDNSNYSGPYLASLPVTIPGYTGPTQWADIPLDLLADRKSILTAKIRCLEHLQPLSYRGGSR
jgi:hypothetical protein